MGVVDKLKRICKLPFNGSNGKSSKEKHSGTKNVDPTVNEKRTVYNNCIILLGSFTDESIINIPNGKNVQLGNQNAMFGAPTTHDEVSSPKSKNDSQSEGFVLEQYDQEPKPYQMSPPGDTDIPIVAMVQENRPLEKLHYELSLKSVESWEKIAKPLGVPYQTYQSIMLGNNMCADMWELYALCMRQNALPSEADAPSLPHTALIDAGHANLADMVKESKVTGKRCMSLAESGYTAGKVDDYDDDAEYAVNVNVPGKSCMSLAESGYAAGEDDDYDEDDDDALNVNGKDVEDDDNDEDDDNGVHHDLVINDHDNDAVNVKENRLLEKLLYRLSVKFGESWAKSADMWGFFALQIFRFWSCLLYLSVYVIVFIE